MGVDRGMLVVLWSASALLLACSTPESKSTDTHSTDFAEKGPKLDFLRKYMSHMEGVQDAEYHIIYHDNGSGWVPGPSDYSITVALLIEPDSLGHWLDECEGKDTMVNINAWRGSLPGFDWSVTGTPYVCRPEPGVEKIVYEQDGIVLARYTTM